MYVCMSGRNVYVEVSCKIGSQKALEVVCMQGRNLLLKLLSFYRLLKIIYILYFISLCFPLDSSLTSWRHARAQLKDLVRVQVLENQKKTTYFI